MRPTANEYEQDEWDISTHWEAQRFTIEMIEGDNATHLNSRCYPVDADSIRGTNPCN